MPEHQLAGSDNPHVIEESTFPNDEISNATVNEIEEAEETEYEEEIEGNETFTAGIISNEVPNTALYIMCFFTEDHWNPYYYIPDDEFIIEFLSYINEDLPSDEFRLDGSIHAEAYPLGYHIIYDDIQWEVWSSGNIVTHNRDESMFVFIDMPEVVNHLRNLMYDIGIYEFNPSIIRQILSAKTEPLSEGFHDFKEYTLTDETKLNELADMLSAANNSLPMACPIDEVFLIITLLSGEHIKLAMSSDSCNYFFINGQMFTFKIKENAYWYEYFFTPT
jgi:hypothetical protein